MVLYTVRYITVQSVESLTTCHVLLVEQAEAVSFDRSFMLSAIANSVQWYHRPPRLQIPSRLPHHHGHTQRNGLAVLALVPRCIPLLLPRGEARFPEGAMARGC